MSDVRLAQLTNLRSTKYVEKDIKISPCVLLVWFVMDICKCLYPRFCQQN